MDRCLIDSCDSSASCRGLCNSDYQKQYRAGNLDQFPLVGGPGPKRKPTSIRYMNPLEIGWVAGIIEGEGNFHAPGNRNPMQIRVGMTDRDIIERLLKVTGVGTITIRETVVVNHKTVYTWVVSPYNDVIHLLASIVPLMGDRRKQQIEHMLDKKGI